MRFGNSTEMFLRPHHQKITRVLYKLNASLCSVILVVGQRWGMICARLSVELRRTLNGLSVAWKCCRLYCPELWFGSRSASCGSWCRAVQVDFSLSLCLCLKMMRTWGGCIGFSGPFSPLKFLSRRHKLISKK